MKVRPITVLCLVYIAIIFYGTLLPFDLAADVDAASDRLDQELKLWRDGFYSNRRDILINFAFFLPLGILAAVRHGGESRLRAVLVAGTAGASISMATEFLQLWSPSRTAEVSDLVMNTAGSLVGGMIGATVGRSVQLKLSGETSDKWSLRPLRPVAITLLLLKRDNFKLQRGW